MMKEILLRVATVRAEIIRNEFRHCLAAWLFARRTKYLSRKTRSIQTSMGNAASSLVGE